MRVNPNHSYTLLAEMETSQDALNKAVDQLASGKRVALPSDDPAAFTANLHSLADSAAADRFTKNAGSAVTLAQQADSTLSSVLSSLTQAVSLGTQGASGSLTATNRNAIATQVQGLLSDVLALANAKSSGGQPLFSGTVVPAAVFTSDSSAASGFVYNGNDGVNQTSIGNDLQVSTGVPGDQIFLSADGNVLGSLHALVSALQSGDTTGIANATSAVSTAITHVSQQRVLYSNTISQAQIQETYLSQETLSLTTQQTALTSIDLPTAATNLTQAQTAHSAILAVAAKILPVSLLDYLKA